MDTKYIAVVNSDGQYSIWPTSKDLPLGWDVAGQEGSKDECLAFIEKVWVDIRPQNTKELHA